MPTVLTAALFLGDRAPPMSAQGPNNPAANTRREYDTPGLVVETGARTAACDVLLFTKTGQVLAAGDDKVVRTWDATTHGLEQPADFRAVLRWPSHREYLGSIQAMALSPDESEVVIAGHGMFPHGFEAAVIDRKTGELKHILSPTPSTFPALEYACATSVWSLAYAPKGNRVALGTSSGGVWIWDCDARAPAYRFVGRHRPGPVLRHQRVVFVAFVDNDHLLSIDGQGQMLLWDLGLAGKGKPQVVFAFAGPVTSATASPDGKSVAAILERPPGASEHIVELVALRPTPGGKSRRINLPGDTEQYLRLAHRAAFSADGHTLAIGVRHVSKTAKRPDAEKFFQEERGQVWLYDLDDPQPRAGPKQSLYAEALAFDPRKPNRLAVAGGDDHEVQLWDVTRDKPPLAVGEPIRSPGHGLWGVRLDPQGRYLAFQQQRNPAALHPNERGQGPWRYFDLKHSPKNPLHLVDAEDAESFLPHRRNPDTEAGWKVHFVKPGVPNSPYRWYVEGPKLPSTPLQWHDDEDDFPRCYAFIPADAKKGRPVRLVVGHYWGVSVFDLRDDLDPTKPIPRTRLFRGHEGEVSALAVSPDGKLVTVSRDQTIAGWNLEDWLAHPSLGAAFFPNGNSLFVSRVDKGSPAWEAGLTPKDEIVELGVAGAPVYRAADAGRGKAIGNVKDALAALTAPKPGIYLAFFWRRPGEAKINGGLVRLIDRPVWRMFPMEGNSWVLWRYRDYFYTDRNSGDYQIGWQRSEKIHKQRAPDFVRAEAYRKEYRRPDRVAAALQSWATETTDRGASTLFEAPQVTIVDEKGRPVQRKIDLGIKDESVSIRIRIEVRGSRPNQKPTDTGAAVRVWVNDHQYATYKVTDLDPVPGGYQKEIKVPADVFRFGINRVLAQCFTTDLVRGDSEPVTVAREGEAPRPKLFGLLVGISDYSGTRFVSLKAREDAEALQRAWQAQEGRRFDKVTLKLLPDRQATPKAILAQLAEFAHQARPNDVFVLYLGGHGTSVSDLRKLGLKQTQLEGLNGFLFCGPKLNFDNLVGTTLPFDSLYEGLVQFRCHKLLLLDACHSGEANRTDTTDDETPIRILTKHGVGPVILAACAPDQEAVESGQMDGGRTFGLFSGGLRRLLEIEEVFKKADTDEDGQLSAQEMANAVKNHVKRLASITRARSADGRVRAGQVQTPVEHIPASERALRLVEWRD
jgi:WD40 repeat protein/uncharacterized caspase-like protein